MQASLSKGPLAPRFTYMVGMGHEAWYPPYENPQFYEWLLEHHRPDAKLKKKLDAMSSVPTTQPTPAAPGHYLLTYETKIGNQPISLDYTLYLPKGYKPGSSPRPAMLFLHEQDTIGPEFKDICMHGPDLLLERKPAMQTNFPFVIISPRLPINCTWETAGMTQTLLALVDHVSETIAIDPDRISITGLNAGAIGAWKTANEAPDRFSALVPLMTTGELTPGDEKIVSSIPGRAFIKASDGQSVGRMTDIISRTKTDWKLTKINETASALGDVPAYYDKQFLTWLEQHKRKTASVSAEAK
jgi:hypothetical protein